MNAEQFTGPLRGLGPLIVGVLVGWGLDDVTAGLVATAVLAIAAAAWSWWSNRNAGLAKQLAKSDEVQITIMPNASQSLKNLAADPKVSNIVPAGKP